MSEQNIESLENQTLLLHFLEEELSASDKEKLEANLSDESFAEKLAMQALLQAELNARGRQERLLELATAELEKETSQQDTSLRNSPKAIKMEEMSPIPNQTKARNWGAIAALLLAAVLLFAGLGVFMNRGPETLATLSQVQPGVIIERDGSAILAYEGMELQVQDTLWVQDDGSAVLKFRDQTTLEVAPNTRLVFSEGQTETSGGTLMLQKGTINTQDIQSDPGRHLVLASKHALAELRGSKVTFKVNAEHSQLDVREGSTKFISKSDTQHPLELRTGQSALASDNLPLQANSTKADLATGLIGFWDMEEGRGIRLADFSPRQQFARLQKGNWVKTAGGHAIAFNGKDSCVDLGQNVDLSGRSTASLHLSFMPHELQRKQVLVDQTGKSTSEFMVFINDKDRLVVSLGSQVFETPAEHKLKKQQWYQLNVTISKNTRQLRIYLNTEMIHQSAFDDLASTPQAISKDRLTLGLHRAEDKEIAKVNFAFRGLIERVMIYNRVLGKTEITALYRQNLDN